MQRNPASPQLPARSLAPVRLFALALLIILIAPAPAAAGWGPPAPVPSAAWRLPVSAPVARGFDLGADPYEGGHHRGVDLRAPAGAIVHAPCGGRVVVAGRVGSSGGVVTVRCGRWRATVLPLSTILVRRGAQVSTRTRIGLLARSPAHRGLHLGVRRDGVRFGYVDPLPFFAARPAAPSPLGRAPRGRPMPPPAVAPPRPAARLRRPAPGGRVVPSPRPAPGGRVAPVGRPAGRGPAPWPAWAGLGLVLAGLGLGARRRRRAWAEPRLRGEVAAS
jgi:LPXTG-motif cell wall-anchored protein